MMYCKLCGNLLDHFILRKFTAKTKTAVVVVSKFVTKISHCFTDFTAISDMTFILIANYDLLLQHNIQIAKRVPFQLNH